MELLKINHNFVQFHQILDKTSVEYIEIEYWRGQVQKVNPQGCDKDYFITCFEKRI